LECTRLALHIYEGYTWYLITIMVLSFGPALPAA